MLRGLEQVLTGAWVRSVAAIRDVGEIFYAIVGDPDGGDTCNMDGANDVWVHSQDPTPAEPTGKITARQFFPLNAFFRLPKKGDAVVVLRPKNVDGPGHGLQLHGDGGGPDNGQVPNWLDDSTCGISVDKETFKIETKGDDADIAVDTAAGRTLLLQGGDKGVARMDDTAKVASLMATWMGQVETAINAVAAGAVAPLSTTFATTSIAIINSASTKTKTG